MEKTYQQERRERYDKVERLRNDGMKWKDIAKEMGVSIARVHSMYLYGDNDVPEGTKKDVRARDNHSCRLCSSRDRNQVHHIDKIETGMNQPENLIVLCLKCHQFAHSIKRLNTFAYGELMRKCGTNFGMPLVSP
jgi:predicted transcriptional regulator